MANDAEPASTDEVAPGPMQADERPPGRTFQLTSTARRAAWPRVASKLMWILVGFALSPGPTGWIVIGAVALISTISAYRSNFQRSLLVGRAGVKYSESSLEVPSYWDNVVGVVQLTRSPDSLALLLRDPAAIEPRKKKWFDALKTTPYPYARIVPIGPFVDRFEGSDVEGLVRQFAPHVLATPRELLEKPTGSTRARALGVVIVVMPLLVLAGALVFQVATRSIPLSVGRGIIYGLVLGVFATPVLLLLHRGSTGERLVDFFGRVLLRPARGESRRSILAPIVLAYVLIFGASLLGTVGVSSPTNTTCDGGAVALEGTPRPEPQWPGDPHASQTLEFGNEWLQTAMTEDGVSRVEVGMTAASAATHARDVRSQIRQGLVQLAERVWKVPDFTQVQLYEHRCPGIQTIDDVGTMLDDEYKLAKDARLGRVRKLVFLGSSAFQRESFTKFQPGGSPVFVDIYAWLHSGHVMYLVSQTVGPGHPASQSIEAALAKLS